MKTNFSEPTKDDYRDLAKRWVSISNLVKEEYGYEICQSLKDLEYIQKVIDDELIDFQNWYALECLGVVFGRVLANNNEDLDWWVVEDSYGRNLIIRYLDTSLQFGVMQMLGKRLSEGSKVDVMWFYNRILNELDELKDKVD